MCKIFMSSALAEFVYIISWGEMMIVFTPVMYFSPFGRINTGEDYE